ncbi:MAG: response regulator [Deltaproteobacteria bacterium]|nr:response regulator [Deltaproteobacteria bacterium]
MGARVLIVDDELNVRRSLAVGLRLSGFEVEDVDGSEAAIVALDRANFDVAIVDLMLPGMNGLDLARRVHADHPAVRVILMSAYHLSPRQVERAEAGVVGFLPKPFRMEEAVRYFREQLDGLNRRAAVRRGNVF